MTPNTDYNPAIADTLAIIQGKESLSSLIDELDSSVYEYVYTKAQELDKTGYFAKSTPNGYTAEKHAPKWTRRVR
jgi:hypothetical protein